ncbi:B3 domain-containing protein REM8-like isoform X2 [Spinacia oleracea]|uniref:B3 domain-containing protein REM8-like isoform X2 n=1 Tax=Spinacia oleracea TaxID=3562 RepID=A0ABM3RNL1_SPIOL|nr:B3 domain-containing protein REM8-like isoform X2 [Spinacia oleracea]
MSKIHHPTYPHFFQPLLPDFLNNFSIPKAFLKNFEGSTKQNQLCEKKIKVELRDKSGKRWFVTLVFSNDDTKPHFKDGWKSFCKDHDLKVGDFLVFRHQATNPRIKSSSIGNKVLKGNGDLEIKMDEEDNINIEGNSSFKPSSYPYCRTVVKYSSKSHEMPLPRQFTEKNGLSKRWCEMKLIDEKGHPWKMLLRYYRCKSNGHSYIGRWRAFLKANGLKTGDVVIFQLINNGEVPVIKFYKE